MGHEPRCIFVVVFSWRPPRCGSSNSTFPLRLSLPWILASSRRRRPASSAVPKPCAPAHHLDRLVDQDPLKHSSSHSQWSGQELATVLARQTGVQLSRESVRDVLKKRRK